MGSTEETEPQLASGVLNNDQDAAVDGPPRKKDLHFWVLLVSIALCQFLAALDSSVLSTALPTVAAELNSGPLYLWIVNTYLLAMTACGPIFGQAADIFGRKSLTLLAIGAFALGSVISATAKSTEQLLVGRTIQGIGGAGCVVMPEILICDLVSLRERAMYVGILTACWGTGTLVAPVVGGALAEAGAWRWIFYLNLPIAGLAAVPMAMLKLRNPNKGQTFWRRLARVDWIGNVILILAVVSLLLSLTYAGNKDPWSSWRTIVPLVLGCLGLVAFAAFEAGPWLPADSRTMPPRLFRNRTAVGGYATSFFHAMMLFWTGYFLPVYFQAVKGALPLRSAVMILPLILTSAPAGFLAGFFTSKTGRCLLWQFVGWGFMAIGAGLLTLLDAESSTGHWVGFQMVFGFGLGVIFTTQLPAILASLDEADVATASAVWIFIRNLGSIWGTTIPAAVFNTRAEELAVSLPEEVRGLLVRGGAFEHATARFMNTFQEIPDVFAALLNMYTASLRLVWQISIAFCGVGFLLCFLMKNLELTSEHNTQWGLEGGAAPEKRDEQTPQGEPVTASP